MKQLSTTAIILKRINFGEADRIITVITADKGKLSLLAKGVRRSKSKLAGGLELFSVTDLTYIDGKSDLKIVVSTRLKAHYKSIVSDIDRTMIAYDFLKIIHAFTDHTDQSAYYSVLETGLVSLNDISLNHSVTQIWFYVRVLSVFGSDINVEKPLDAAGFTEDATYNFSYDDMSFYSHVSGQFKPNHIKFLRLVVRSDSPAKLASIQGSDDLAQDLVQTIKQASMMHKA